MNDLDLQREHAEFARIVREVYCTMIANGERPNRAAFIRRTQAAWRDLWLPRVRLLAKNRQLNPTPLEKPAHE